MNVFDRVRTAAADVLEVAPETLSESSTPEGLDQWDSIRHLSLVMALEAQFGVEFAPEEIDQMKSLATIVALVEAKIG